MTRFSAAVMIRSPQSMAESATNDAMAWARLSSTGSTQHFVRSPMSGTRRVVAKALIDLDESKDSVPSAGLALYRLPAVGAELGARCQGRTAGPAEIRWPRSSRQSAALRDLLIHRRRSNHP